MKKFSYRKPASSELKILTGKNLDIAHEKFKHSFFHSELGIFTIRTTLPNTNYQIYSIVNTTQNNIPSIQINISDCTEKESRSQSKNYIAETSFHYDDIIHITDNEFDFKTTDFVNIKIYNDSKYCDFFNDQKNNSPKDEQGFLDSYKGDIQNYSYNKSFIDFFKVIMPNEGGDGGVITRNP